ncbi:MAG: autotransporter domain-containing protein [Planctomycetaceae bacterium]|nr:autotransporter domain-containing protein [Planctomycetaceae bacterium]
MVCPLHDTSLRRRIGVVMVLTAMVTVAAARAWAIDFPGTLGSGTFILDDANDPIEVPPTVTMDTGSFIIGGDGYGFALSIDKLEAEAANAAQTITIESGNQQGTTGTGVQVTVGTFDPKDMDRISVNIGDSNRNGTNKFIIQTFQNNNIPGPVDFTVGDGSELHINASTKGLGYQSSVEITLEQGSVFLQGNSNKLLNGFIAGFGDSFVVANSLTIGASTTAGDNATLSANGGALHILRNATGSPSPGDYANVTVGGGSGNGFLEIIDGEINVANLTLKANSAFSAATTTGTLNVYGDLTVDGDFVDARDVDTIVRGETEITLGSTYTVNGTGNNYQGTMTVTGTLVNDATDDTILLGIDNGKTPATRGSMEITGGSVVARGGRFTIDNADILITKGPAAGSHTLWADTAVLDLGTSNVTVSLTSQNDKATIQADEDILMLGYRQLRGMVDVTSPTGGQMKVTERAVVGSAAAGQVVGLDVSGNAVVFSGGLTLGEYGALSATRTSGTINLGTAGTAEHLVMNGNNILYAGAGNTLTLKSAYTGKDSVRLEVNGTENGAYGDIDARQFAGVINQSGELTVASTGTDSLKLASLAVGGRLYLGVDDYPTGVTGGGSGAAAGATIDVTGDFRVNSGGRAIANYADAVITSTNNGLFHVAAGGHLTADTAKIFALGFSAVNLNGTFTAGILGGIGDTVETPRFIADSDIKIESTGIIALTTDFAKAAVAGDSEVGASWIMETTGVITSDADLKTESIMGKFGYDISDNRHILYVSSIEGRVILDGSDDDRQQAIDNLRDMWCPGQIKDDLGNLIYDIVKGDVVSDASDAGDKNIAIMDAIANPNGHVVGKDTLEYINGAHLYGPTDVSMEASRMFMSDLQARSKAIHCQFTALRDYADGSAACSGAVQDARHLNRLWAGATAYTHSVDGKNCFSGYDYEGYGLVGGYDRVVAENVAVGAAFAYNRGDYEDKGALASDSEIETMSVGLYGTWSHCSGAFASLSGAYTYAQNNLKDSRRDPSIEDAAWAESEYRTTTLNLAAVFGVDFRLNDCWTVTPSIGVNYLQAKNSDHDSFLDGIATQRIRGVKNRRVHLPAELMIQYTRNLIGGGGLRFFAKGGYSYNLRESGMTGSVDYYGLDPSRSISVHGRNNPRSTYTFGAGVAYNCTRYELGARYDFAGREDSRTHRLLGTVGMYF